MPKEARRPTFVSRYRRVRRLRMCRVERVGVSLDKKLLAMFDQLIARQGYPKRRRTDLAKAFPADRVI